jgi:hypothetical protein
VLFCHPEQAAVLAYAKIWSEKISLSNLSEKYYY